MTATTQKPLPRAAWTELSKTLFDTIHAKSLNVGEPLLVEAVARAYNPNATGPHLETVLARAQRVIDALVNCTLTDVDLLSGYPRPWFSAIESVLHLPEGYCNGILDAVTAATAQSPTVWDGMGEAPAEEDTEPEPEATVFETLDDKNPNPDLTLATADLEALANLDAPWLREWKALFPHGVQIVPDKISEPVQPTERERLTSRVAQISTSFVDALMALEHLRVDGVRPGALAAAKNTTANAFTEAIKAITGIEDHK